MSEQRILELAAAYQQAGEAEKDAIGSINIDQRALDRRLREILASGGVVPEQIEAEFERIMRVVFAGV